MNLRDWRYFLSGKRKEPLAIAQLSKEMADHLGASSRNVYLGYECARKAVDKHGLLAIHFPVIFEVVDFGAAIADRERHITFLHFDEVVTTGRWFQVSVKRGFEDRRIFVTTFQ